MSIGLRVKPSVFTFRHRAADTNRPSMCQCWYGKLRWSPSSWRGPSTGQSARVSAPVGAHYGHVVDDAHPTFQDAAGVCRHLAPHFHVRRIHWHTSAAGLWLLYCVPHCHVVMPPAISQRLHRPHAAVTTPVRTGISAELHSGSPRLSFSSGSFSAVIRREAPAAPVLEILPIVAAVSDALSVPRHTPRSAGAELSAGRSRGCTGRVASSLPRYPRQSASRSGHPSTHTLSIAPMGRLVAHFHKSHCRRPAPVAIGILIFTVVLKLQYYRLVRPPRNGTRVDLHHSFAASLLPGRGGISQHGAGGGYAPRNGVTPLHFGQTPPRCLLIRHLNSRFSIRSQRLI